MSANRFHYIHEIFLFRRQSRRVAQMEIPGLTDKINDPELPLSALRLLVPPLQLRSAAMWQLAKRRDVMNYNRLQEFVLTVTEAVPGLLNLSQRAQLVLGLRARFILELCKDSSPGSVDTQMIQNLLERLPISSANVDCGDAEVKKTESIFIALVQSLLKDPVERAYFFQEVFPVEYGPQFDSALHVLLWELLSKLEKLLPVPDLKQTAAWLGSSPSVQEECFQSTPEELAVIFKHYKASGRLKMPYSPSSTIGSWIMSALSIPPSQKNPASVGLESIHNYANVLSPVTLVGAGEYRVVTVYTEVEVGASEELNECAEVQADYLERDGEEEVVAAGADPASSEEAPGLRADETVEVARALQTLTKTFALRKENLVQEAQTGQINKYTAGNSTEEGEAQGERDMCKRTEGQSVDTVKDATASSSSGGAENNQNACSEAKANAEHHLEIEGTADVWSEPDASDAQQSGSADMRRSTRLQRKTSPTPPETHHFKRSRVSGSATPSIIAVKGDSEETTSIIFTCSRCPFHSADRNSPPHFHMQSVRTETYRDLSGAEFTPSPSGTDQIFTSIKLFPGRDGEEGTAEGPGDDGSLGASRSHGKAKALTCETCGKTFTRTSDVRRHQLTHTGERPFRCSQCDRTFQHSWDLAKHQSKSHDASVSFSCRPCGSSFANLRALTAHHKKSHSQESQLPEICSICGHSFRSPSELSEHRRSHVTGKRYVCQQCGEGFDTLLARSQHRQAHQVKRQFKCPQCEKTYTRRSDVKRHLSTHTGERPFKCAQCGKRFSLRFMLTKHLHVHSGERPFQCSHCPSRFTLASVLARHERMHTGEKPFLCSQCGKGFLSKGELSKHHRSHLDDRPYPCPQCDKRFKSKKAQQDHITSHSGVRPYPCAYCGKGFTKPYALTRHNLIHTGERPFPCAHCEKTFLSLNEAQLHQRIHTGEKPYACDVCELRFKGSSELARHKRGHSGLRPPRPRCDKCRKTFTSKVKLRKHMETHADPATE